jgi:hypothetical protein
MRLKPGKAYAITSASAVDGYNAIDSITLIHTNLEG